MAEKLPEKFEKLTTEDGADGADADEKKRQKRGGKGMMKAKKKETEVEKKDNSLNCPKG